MLQLPEKFIRKMTEMLGSDAPRFFASYNEPRTQGLRLNPLKCLPESEAADRLRERFGLTPVPWCSSGYYYREDARPGKHPYHAAGVYYIQEPSAMSPAERLDPKPGEVVLDLAAAPGGKSTQIAGKMQGDGLLVANEIHPARARILAENIERMGIANAVVTSATPGELAARFPLFFDRIMLDAPCSGEGMFRKDPEAIAEWSPELVGMCAARQEDILNDAVRMLKPGGTLAYSTCTFSPEENEETIAKLQEAYPEFELLGMERFWPHKERGEGHFVALLRKRPAEAEAAAALRQRPDKPAAHAEEPPSARRKGAGRDGGRKRGAEGALAEAMEQFARFREETLPGFTLGPGEPMLFGEQLYWLPHAAGCPFDSSYLHGLRTLRPGLHLAERKKNRLEPAHALALASACADASHCLTLAADSPEADAYLRGETIPAADGSGWTLVAIDGFPVGWGKASGGQLKNHYPKGLRRVGIEKS